MRRSTLSRRSRALIEQLENRLLLSTGLVVTYDSNGISTLSFDGQTLINVPQYGSSNAYQVNRYYTLNADGTYTAIYGGTGYTSNWNAATLTLTYTYSFGSIAVQFVQPSDSRLNMIFTVTNNANSGVTLGGVDIYPAAIHFPEPLPVSYYVGTEAMWSPIVDTTLDGPNIIPANYQSGSMAFVNDSDPTKPIYTSLFTLDNTTGENYYLFVGTGPKDNLPTGLPVFYRNTAPGQTDSFEESLRFGPAGADPYALATDVEQNYAAAYPDLVNWPDRRPIASLHLTSPPTYPDNPEGWFNDSSSVDTTTQAGLNAFGAELLQYAESSVTVMKADNAQGMIVWDVEGQEWPQATTYIGDPALAFDTRIEQGVTLSNGTITTPMGYDYLGGGPLIDQFFAIFRNAGFRTGVTIRPTELEFDANGTPSQVTADEASELEAKITYAYDRWGCTLFYVDSNSGYDRDALRAVQKMFPYVLLIPEHSTTATDGESAPYGQLLTYNFTGTPSYVYDTYPNAFSVIYPADGDNGNSSLPDYYSQIEQSVANGDIILFRGWYNDPYNTTMNQIYAQAAAVPPTPTGLTATPSNTGMQLTWNTVAVTATGVFSTGVYNVKRSTSSAGPFTTIASGVFGPAFTDTIAKGNTRYYYEVSAVDGAGESANSSSVNATISVTAIAGDQDYSNEPDTIRVVRSGSNINIYRNNSTTPAYQLTYATTPEVSISAGGGNDTIILDYTGGDPIPPTGLSIDGGTGTDLISVIGTGGNDSIALAAGSIAVNGGAFTYSNAENLALSLSSGNSTLTATGPAPITGAFDLSLANSAALTVTNPTYLDVATLNLANNSSLILAAGGNTTLETPSLNIASTATLQLNDNALVVDYTTSPPASIAAALAAGLSTGTGITSSLMTADPNSGMEVGSLDSAATGLTTFNAECIGSTSLLLRATWIGDVNMDGYLNADDLSLLLLNQQTGRTGWSAGDFNYDTKINADDTMLLMYAIAVSKGQSVPSVTQSSVAVDADLQSLLTDDGSIL